LQAAQEFCYGPQLHAVRHEITSVTLKSITNIVKVSHMESTQNPSASLVKLALTTPSRSDVVAIFKVRCAACRAETRGGRADWVGKVEIREAGNRVAFARFRHGGSRHDVAVAMSHVASPGQFEAKCRH